MCGEEITLTRGPFLGIPRSHLTDHVALVSIIFLHYSSSQWFGLLFVDAYLGLYPGELFTNFVFLFVVIALLFPSWGINNPG